MLLTMPSCCGNTTKTNAAASPTKFAEYSLAGLPVIMTDAVPDSYALAKRLGNLVEYREGQVGALTLGDRDAVMESYRPILTKSGYLDAYRRVYGSN